MIFFEEYGNRDNPAILFLHGANFPHTFIKEYCLADRYRLIVPHIYGYGRESARIYNTEEVFEALCKLIESLGVKVIPVGFSLGAQLAVMLVSKRPDLCAGGIFVSAWVVKNPGTVEFVTKRFVASMPTIKLKWIARIQANCTGLREEKDIEEFSRWVRSVREETFRNTVDSKINIDDFADKFAAVSYPTLAICGALEYKGVRKNSLERMAELNPLCRTQTWAGAGHNIPMAFSEKLTETIDGYMKEVIHTV